MTCNYAKSMTLLCIFSLTATPLLDARVSPKMRGKAGKALKQNRYKLTGNEEVVYVNKLTCGLLSAGAIGFGALAGYLGYFSNDLDLTTGDKYFFGIFTPFWLSGGLYMAKYLFNNKPYLIINEKGIRSQDHGFWTWNSITSFKLVKIDHGSLLTLLTITGKKITISDIILKSSAPEIIKKIGRYRKITYLPEYNNFLLEDHQKTAGVA